MHFLHPYQISHTKSLSLPRSEQPYYYYYYYCFYFRQHWMRQSKRQSNQSIYKTTIYILQTLFIVSPMIYCPSPPASDSGCRVFGLVPSLRSSCPFPFISRWRWWEYLRRSRCTAEDCGNCRKAATTTEIETTITRMAFTWETITFRISLFRLAVNYLLM